MTKILVFLLLLAYCPSLQAATADISLNELAYDLNPANTGNAIKVKTEGQRTYAYINGKKQYIDIGDTLKKQAQDFTALIINGIQTGKINKMSDDESKKAMDAWVVFYYTDYEMQGPVYYCRKYYPVFKYQEVFKKTFEKSHSEAKQRLIKLWGESGYKYVSTEYKKIMLPDTLTMDENYKDFTELMKMEGITSVDKTMFCKFIDYAPELVLEQQVEVFKIQHPDYMQFLPNAMSK